MGIRIITGYTGSPHVNSDDAASLNRSIFGVGQDRILGGIGKECEATLNTDGSTVTIDVGDLIIDGVHARIESPVTVGIENGTQGQYRSDLICATYTKTPSTQLEHVTIRVIKGEPGSTAIDPTYYDNLIGQNDAGTVGAGSNTRDMVLYRVIRYGATIQRVEKVAKTYHFIDTSDGAFIKGENEGYAQIKHYGKHALGLYAADENKSRKVGLVIYSNGAIGYFYGEGLSKYFGLPFVQSGKVTKPVGTVAVNVTFPKEYSAAPIVVATNQNGNTSGVAVVNITTKGFTILSSIPSNQTAPIGWVAVGTQLA